MPKNTATGQQAAYAERRTKALELNVRGRSLPEIVRISQLEGWLPRPYNSPQAVHADITKALAQRAEQRNKMAGVYLQRELEKLDAMETAAWDVLESLHYVVNQGELVYVYPEEQPKLVKQGWARPKLDEEETVKALEDGAEKVAREPLIDNKPILDALNVLLKIAERRSKLLGLDAPVKKQVEVSGGINVDHEIGTLMAVLAAGGQGSLAPPPTPGERPKVVRHPRSVSKAHRAPNGADTGAGAA